MLESGGSDRVVVPTKLYGFDLLHRGIIFFIHFGQHLNSVAADAEH